MSSCGPNHTPRMMSSTALSGVDACQCRPGVNAWKSTGSANNVRIPSWSFTASACANCSPSVVCIVVHLPSVAECGRGIVADPLPHGYGSAQRGIRDQAGFGQSSGVETDRAHQVPTAGDLVPAGELR